MSEMCHTVSMKKVFVLLLMILLFSLTACNWLWGSKKVKLDKDIAAEAMASVPTDKNGNVDCDTFDCDEKVTIRGVEYICEYHGSEILLHSESGEKVIDFTYLRNASQKYDSLFTKLPSPPMPEQIVKINNAVYIVCVYNAGVYYYTSYAMFFELNTETEDVLYITYFERKYDWRD